MASVTKVSNPVARRKWIILRTSSFGVGQQPGA